MILNYKKPNILTQSQLDSVVFTPIRKCGECGETKPFFEFHKNKGKRFGINHLCKNCNKIRAAKWKKENPDKVKETGKKWNEENKEKVSEYNKKYYEKNSDKLKELNKEYRKENFDKIKKYIKTYRKERYKNDNIYKVLVSTRRRILNIFKQKKLIKNKKTLEILGTTFENLTIYLESQFKDGMSWENRNEWHIDHIIPLCSATTEEELYRLCHYTNLQPLWATENIKKGGKIL